MLEIVRLLRHVAATPLPVLILGETGTGKEVLADLVHQASTRSARPFVKINCAGLTEAVVESELFGHERGSFTGATAAHDGLFEAADGGTLFLDEVAELPLRTQAKLLRVLESGEYMRVGATRARRSSFRVVAATHRALEAAVQEGHFRQDLFFRLAGLTVEVPPLRERPAELLALATMWIERACGTLGRPVPSLSEPARAALLAHSWPGNVRELRNVMERAAAIATGATVRVEDLALGPSRPATRSEPPRSEPPRSDAPPADPRRVLRRELDEAEHRHILRALEETQGNQTQAAKLLGLSRRTLSNKLNTHGIARPRKRAFAQEESLELGAAQLKDER